MPDFDLVVAVPKGGVALRVSVSYEIGLPTGVSQGLPFGTSPIGGSVDAMELTHDSERVLTCQGNGQVGMLLNAGSMLKAGYQRSIRQTLFANAEGHITLDPMGTRSIFGFTSAEDFSGEIVVPTEP